MKWYQENFVNRRDWILDNLADLKMSYEEIVVVLLIDFFNSNNINITFSNNELLSKKLQLYDAKCNECDNIKIIYK